MPQLSPHTLDLSALAPTSTSSPSSLNTSALVTLADVLKTDDFLNRQAELAHLANEAAGEILRLCKHQKEEVAVVKARDLIQSAALSRVLLQPAASDAALSTNTALGWQGLLANMLVCPAFRLQNAPLLGDVPEFLWGEYVTWLFAEPAFFLDGEDESRFANHLNRHLPELARWIDRNVGARCVRDALDAYLRLPPSRHVATGLEASRKIRETTAHLLTRLVARGDTLSEVKAAPRYGRKLRVGVLCDDFGPLSTSSRITSALFEQADTTVLDFIVYAAEGAGCALDQRCQALGVGFVPLPGGAAERLTLLREAALDVLVLFADTALHPASLSSRIALRRVAPLQVAVGNGLTTGLPHVDLYVVGEMANPAQLAPLFSERLCIAAGLGAVFAPWEGNNDACPGIGREELGIASTTRVFVSAVSRCIPAYSTRAAWARLLADESDSILILQLIDDETGTVRAGDVSAAFNLLFDQHKIDASRLVVADPRPLAETRAVLRLGDVYLSPMGGFDRRWLCEALRLGLPVVARLDDPLHLTAAIMRSAGSEAWVAATPDEYHRLALTLLRSSDARSRAVADITSKLDAGPAFQDTLGGADSFAMALTTAYDDLEQLGTRRFRREAPLLAFTPMSRLDEAVEECQRLLTAGDVARAEDICAKLMSAAPHHPTIRLIQGRLLLVRGEPARAITYLLAAVQQLSDMPTAWLDLCQALRANQQFPEAIEALETYLRLEPRRTEGWLLLVELADAVHSTDIAQDALRVLEELAPADPKVQELAARFSA